MNSRVWRLFIQTERERGGEFKLEDELGAADAARPAKPGGAFGACLLNYLLGLKCSLHHAHSHRP